MLILSIHKLVYERCCVSCQGLSRGGFKVLEESSFSCQNVLVNHVSIRHTVEELQEFSNTRVPGTKLNETLLMVTMLIFRTSLHIFIVPPSVRSIRLLIPLSSCSQAATYLIKVLGGEEQARHILGGTRWWQVRGVKGIDANWIVVKKDLEVANKMRKMGFQQENGNEHETGGDNAESDGQYSSELDPLRCMYYIHGGEYRRLGIMIRPLEPLFWWSDQVDISLVLLTKKGIPCNGMQGGFSSIFSKPNPAQLNTRRKMNGRIFGSCQQVSICRNSSHILIIFQPSIIALHLSTLSL